MNFSRYKPQYTSLLKFGNGKCNEFFEIPDFQENRCGDTFWDFPIKTDDFWENYTNLALAVGKTFQFYKSLKTWDNTQYRTFDLRAPNSENIFGRADIPNSFSLTIFIVNLVPDCQRTTFIIAKCKQKTETFNFGEIKKNYWFDKWNFSTAFSHIEAL